MSLIKGNSFEVVINKESSRKTLNAVGFTKSMQRAFGMRASSLQVRNDDRVFKFAANLLGKQYGNPIVDSKKNFYPYKLVKDEERETYGISITNGTQEVIFTPEEIIGMILEHGKEAAEAFSESSVKDCVITVPPYWTHHERKALIQAAKFAGLNVLTVINELTAVAVKYSISRKFDATENVLFYDLGESTTKVIVVSFSKFVDEKNKTVPQMQVLSSKWDTSIGVRDLENSLVQHFADLINQDKASHKYTGGDIRKHKGAMGKLAKETRRTKEVLSANTETIVSVDGIIGEYDFRAQITRETFEKINENNWSKLVDIARSALKDADVDVKDLSAFELVGGGIRIPRVYESLRQFYGRESLDRHLNGDESACQGAAYYGVTKSIVFKTQSIQVRDINPYPVSLTILDDTMENNKKVFFRDNSKFDDKKTLSFRSFNDTQIRFDYESHKNIPDYSPLPLAIFNITGMPTSQEYNFTTTPKITATIVYRNGVVSIEKADVRFRYATTQKITKKIKKEEKEKKEDKSAEPVDDEATDAEEEKETKKETTKDAKDSKTKKDEKPYEEIVVFEPVNKTKTVNLVVTGSSLGIPDFSPERLKEIIQRYNRLNKIESNRIKRQKALNDLESFILNNRDALEEKGFVDASTSTERDNIKQIFDNNLEWLEDEGSSASLKELEKRIKEVKREVERVNYRISESTAFPLAVKNCRATCNFTRLVLENITQTHEVTETEYEIAIKDLGELEEYLNEKEKEQSDVPLYEDPKISSSSINSKCNVFTSLTKRLLTRKRRVPKKETKIETSNNSTESTSDSSSSEKAQSKKDDDNSDDDPTNEKEETPEKEEEIL